MKQIGHYKSDWYIMGIDGKYNNACISHTESQLRYTEPKSPEWTINGLELAYLREHGFEEGLTINRKDPKKDYAPDNCEWITSAENNRQARPHKLCEGINLDTGEVVQFLNIREFAKERGLSYSAIDQVLHKHNKTHKNWTFRYVA